MTISVDRKDLLTLTAHLLPLVSAVGSVWCDKVLLRAIDNKLTARGYDGVRGVVAHCGIAYAENFEACAATRDVHDAAKTLADGAVRIDVDGANVVLRNGDRVRRIPRIELAEDTFPKPPRSDCELMCGVPLSALMERVSWAANPIGEGEASWTRVVHVRAGVGMIRAIAMSRHGGAEFELPYDGDGSADLPIALAIMAKRDRVDVCDVASNRIILPGADMTCSAHDAWPNERPFVSEQIGRPMVLGREPLFVALKALQPFADDGMVLFRADGADVSLFAKSKQSSAVDKLPVQAEYDLNRVALVLQNVLRAIESWSGDHVALSWTGGREPVDLRPWPASGGTHAFFPAGSWPGD